MIDEGKRRNGCDICKNERGFSVFKIRNDI